MAEQNNNNNSNNNSSISKFANKCIDAGYIGRINLHGSIIHNFKYEIEVWTCTNMRSNKYETLNEAIQDYIALEAKMQEQKDETKKKRKQIG